MRIRQLSAGIDSLYWSSPCGIAAPQMAADAAECSAPAALAVEQLHHLHRGDRKRELVPELEAARVGGDRTHAQPELARPCAQLVQELWIRIQCRHLVTSPRQVQCHSPGAGADVQDRAVRALGELAP